jgi:hypothetical protein
VDATSPEFRAMAAEHKAIMDRVALVTFSWANVENSMVMLLRAIIRDEAGGLASAIFFAPSNLETRFSIVDRALREVCYQRPPASPIVASWGTWLNTLNRLKGTRNKIAHGHISTVAMGGKQHVRLTAPIFDFERSRTAHRSRQVPGLSSSDIQSHLDAVSRVLDVLTKFQKAIEHLGQPNSQEFQRALVDLIANSSPAPTRGDGSNSSAAVPAA